VTSDTDEVLLEQAAVDEGFMRQALALAASVELPRDVNPRVGAIVVSAEGEVVGEGFHLGSGTDHAEVVALAQADGLAVGSTVYSTLEPCAHKGKKNPCTHALIEAGVARVVYAQQDPNPAMAGGAAALVTAGVDVTSGALADDAKALNSSWTFAHKHGRPWVVWKTATTLDGFVAAVDGSSKWITGEEARAQVQDIRESVGSIITGTGTVLADDPLLTARDLADDEQPLRVVVGKRSIPDEARILTGSKPARLMDADIADVLQTLWREHGIHRVLVEAGPGLSNAIWQQGLVDEVFWFQAPVILGQGRSAIGDIGLGSLDAASRFSAYSVNRVGLDIVIHFTTRQG